MRKSILIIGTVVLSILNSNATNTFEHFNSLIEVVDISKAHVTQIFEWKVETHKGNYSGTSLSLKQAKNMIALVSSGEIITSKEIKSYYVLKSEVNSPEKRNYFWEVKTTSGYAKGYASTEAYAHKMIALVASGDTIIDKIIFSQPQQK